MIQVLATKLLSHDTIQHARTLNFEVICTEFIEIKPLPWDANLLKYKSCSSVAFTSSNAVNCFLSAPGAKEWIKGKHIYALSGKTHETLLAFCLEASFIADSARGLSEALLKMPDLHEVLHICGNLRLDIMERKLQNTHISYKDLIVYDTTIKAGVPVPETFDAILFFSPSAVDGFFANGSLRRSTVCACIGNTTAAKLRQHVNEMSILVSKSPDPEGILNVLKNHFQKSKSK